MREILFKAKRIDNGEWVEGCYLDGNNIGIFYDDTEEEDCKVHIFPVDSNTLCQYTGLTDKNGNKIWENDVVEIPTENGYFTIEWSNTEARWQMDNEIDNFIVDFDNYWSYEVEVIGNIFDNPELMKGGAADE